MRALDVPRVLPQIVQQHFDELDFLCEIREAVIFAPDWTPSDLATHEERMEAHLDGLRIAGRHALEIAQPVLTGEHGSAATAAALVSMESRDPDAAQAVLQALSKAEWPALQGLRLGLRLAQIEPLLDALRSLAAEAPAHVAAAALDVLAFHGAPESRRMAELLAWDDPEVSILAWGAAGRGARVLREDDLARALVASEPRLQRSALEACAHQGLPRLRELCTRAALDAEQPSAEALAFLGVLGYREDIGLLGERARAGPLAEAALRGLGALGALESIPLLLACMSDADRAHAAAAAFERITGIADVEGAPAAEAAPDSTDAEFRDDPPPPDPARADAEWQPLRAELPADGLCQSGRAVPDSIEVADFDLLPLAVRRDLLLRARARGSSARPGLELEARAARRRPA